MKLETQRTITGLIQAAITDPIEKESALKVFSAANPPKREKMLKTREAATLAGVHIHTLRQWERKGFLHPKHITARRVRWPQSELEAFLHESAGV